MTESTTELANGNNQNELANKEEIEQKALSLKNNLDLSKPDSIFKFGLEPQNKLAETSDEIISAVKTKDSGSLNKNLTALEMIFKQEDQTQSTNPLVRGWHKVTNKLYEQKVKRQNLSATIENIGTNLTKDRDKLISNNNHLYDLYISSLTQANNLKPYIRAGELAMEELQNKTLADLKAKADAGDLEAQGKYHQELFIYHRLSRRVNDLRLAQQANVNLAAQVNSTDIANNALIEQVNETVGLLVPLWKGNSAVQIMSNQTAQTAKILKKIKQFSNEQIKTSSKQIHDLTVQAYKDQENGILDLDTLKQSSDTIISAIKECRDIAAEGEKKRQEAVKTVAEVSQKLQGALDETKRQLSTSQN